MLRQVMSIVNGLSPAPFFQLWGNSGVLTSSKSKGTLCKSVSVSVKQPGSMTASKGFTLRSSSFVSAKSKP